MHSRVVSKRLYDFILLLAILELLIIIIPIVVSISHSTFSSFANFIIDGLYVGIMLLLIINGAIVIFMTLNRSYYRSIIDYYKIERCLINLKIYDVYKENIVVLPKIKIDFKHKVIEFDVSNPSFRIKIENNIDVFSSGLPEDWIVTKYYLNENMSRLYLEYEVLKEVNDTIFEEFSEFIGFVSSLPYETFSLGDVLSWNTRQNPHCLIVGGTGQGKSYITIRNIITSALIKKWNVSILDIKGQYHIFDKVCITAYDIESIANELRNIVEEMESRKKLLQECIKDNPDVLAHDIGLPNHLIVIEEYISLINATNDKKLIKEIEDNILKIAVLSRSLGFNLLMIMQQSGTNVLPSQIRSQLSLRILMGIPTQSTYEVAFETKERVKVFTKFTLGCGIASSDGINVVKFKGYIFKYSMKDVISWLLSCQSSSM